MPKRKPATESIAAEELRKGDVLAPRRGYGEAIVHSVDHVDAVVLIVAHEARHGAYSFTVNPATHVRIRPRAAE